MIVSNRDLRNIYFFTSALLSTAFQIDCLPANSAMNIDDYKNINNYNNAKERTSFLSSKVSLRNTSVNSKASSMGYHKRMEIQNKLSDKELIEPINNSQLSYNDNSTKIPCSNKVISQNSPQGSQHVSNEALALNSSTTPCVDDNNVINIQLLYNLNQPIESKLWDSNFQPISLHGLLEHLSSDASNLKKYMFCMAKYIQNKKINTSKSNNIKDFEDIGKAI